MVLWEPAKVWIWMERTKKRVSWLGVLIEQWTWGLKQLGPWFGKIFQQKESNFSVGFVSKNLQYIQTSIRVVSFSQLLWQKNQLQLRFHIYPRAFNSYVAAKDASPADWHDKLANFNLVARVFIVNAIRTSGFWKMFLNKSRWKDQQKEGVEKKNNTKGKGRTDIHFIMFYHFAGTKLRVESWNDEAKTTRKTAAPTVWQPFSLPRSGNLRLHKTQDTSTLVMGF